jgi:hypothetical protein
MASLPLIVFLGLIGFATGLFGCFKPNQQYSTCASCTPTCGNQNPAPCDNTGCTRGCGCSQGYVQDDYGGCIQPRDCKKVIVGSANAVAMKDTVVDTAASRRAATADLVNVTVTRGKIITETVTVDVSASEASSGTNTAIAFPKTCVQGRKAAERTRNGPTKRKFSRDVAKHRIVWIHCPSTVPCTQRLEVAFAKKAM